MPHVRNRAVNPLSRALRHAKAVSVTPSGPCLCALPRSCTAQVCRAPDGRAKRPRTGTDSLAARPYGALDDTNTRPAACSAVHRALVCPQRLLRQGSQDRGAAEAPTIRGAMHPRVSTHERTYPEWSSLGTHEGTCRSHSGVLRGDG